MTLISSKATLQPENAALFFRLGLASTLIRHENIVFRKRSSNLNLNLKTLALRCNVDGKHLENETFRKRGVTIVM